MLATMLDGALPGGYARDDLAAILGVVFAASRRVVEEACR
jgi:hypothetical protein